MFIRYNCFLCTELRKRHRLDRENLTLMSQPFHTMFLFNLAAFLYMKQSFSYVMRRNHWLVAISILAVSFGFFLLVLDGPHEKVLCTPFRLK